MWEEVFDKQILRGTHCSASLGALAIDVSVHSLGTKGGIASDSLCHPWGRARPANAQDPHPRMRAEA